MNASSSKKGPLIFLDYDQAELNAAYNQAAYAPNIQQILSRYGSNSVLTRMRLGEPMVEAYGPHDIEKLCFFETKQKDAPTFLFVHGGAWKGGTAKDYAFLADMFVGAGANYGMMDFSWVQDVGGNLAELSNQVCRAIAWVYRNADRLGFAAERLYIGGHSSGAHLASTAVICDWEKEFGLPQTLIKGALLISGMYDLKPVRLSARSAPT
jgi:arylformamidase